MTLSRTARILIALLLVAAAAFVWINFFAETPDTPPIGAPTVEAPATPADGDAVIGDGADGDGADGVTVDGDATPLPTPPTPSATADATDATDDAGAQAAPGSEAGPPTVVAPADVDVVGRDVVVAELPFLITEPPAVAAATEAEAEAAASGAARPGFGTRASVNPFSPIVVQEPAQAAAPPAEPASPEVVDVEVPSAPEVQTVEAAPQAPRAPAPSALAPASPRTTSLPRALPGGTLPVAPDVLTSSRSEPRQIAPPDLSARAVIREPSTPGDAPTLRPIGGAEASADGATQPAPLAPGEVASAGIPDRPLVSGADTLSQYLRDRNVSFTGSVVGSVGVGVFRVNGTSSPIVLALGQPLPDTDIVLTDLRGQAAQFTLGDTTHVLNLDLRR
ncbi:MAG: hypothetical protein U5J97_06095 [Trueperaceae bacterium]|nr:hypothetical protein [Trueperaceae bacterium]